MATKDQLAFLRKKASGIIRKSTFHAKLRRKLLSMGGEEVVLLPQRKASVEKILKRGFIQAGKSVNLRRGERSQCHANAATLWKENPEEVQIVTGYALTKDDGLWRQHTWALEKGRIIETTVKRSIYFGCALSRAESEEFHYLNR